MLWVGGRIVLDFFFFFFRIFKGKTKPVHLMGPVKLTVQKIELSFLFFLSYIQRFKILRIEIK